jgi:hypothetical protein
MAERSSHSGGMKIYSGHNGAREGIEGGSLFNGLTDIDLPRTRVEG